MAAPGGPDPETWAKMSPMEKTVHRIIGLVLLIVIGGLALLKFFGYA